MEEGQDSQTPCDINTALDSEWEEWKKTHNKQYKSQAEERMRRKNWEKTRQTIAQHNEEYAQGKHSFTMGMNQFGDLGPGESPCCCRGLKPHRDGKK
ncbi:protein CTLA-2-beta-like [Rhinophrynus dorsalis]